MTLDSRKPMLHEPCKTPLIKPRVRIGHCSIAKAAPAGHSAPMPMPSKVRNTKRNQNVGEKPAMKLQIEYHRIEIISGVLRPTRSASHPDAVAPSRRSHNVTVNTKVTSTSGTLNSLAIGTMINRKIVKSNESSVQPSQAATQASHWSLVGSFHQATVFAVSAATAITLLPLSVPDDRDRDRVPESCYIPDYSQRDYQRQAARNRNFVLISARNTGGTGRCRSLPLLP